MSARASLSKLIGLGLALSLIAGVAWAKGGKGAAKAARESVKAFTKQDPGLKKFIKKSYGYAVFPQVTKGGIGIGGAYGEGFVYRKGKLVGRSKLMQATIGLQLGGQAYRELICFKDKATFDRFTAGNFEFSAQASAVAATAGASANAGYTNNVAIFTLTTAGLMYEASVGGQKFEYEKLGK